MMDPREYGMALFLLSKEEGLEEPILEQAKTVSDLLCEHPKYITLLDTPAVSTAEKLTMVDTAFAGTHIYLLNFLKILVSKRSVHLFSHAYKAYKDAYEEENNILHANAVTAVPLTEVQNKALTEKLCRITAKNVILHNKVDATLVGGVRLQFGGKQFDSSIEAQLTSLRKSLKQSTL